MYPLTLLKWRDNRTLLFESTCGNIVVLLLLDIAIDASGLHPSNCFLVADFMLQSDF